MAKSSFNIYIQYIYTCVYIYIVYVCVYMWMTINPNRQNAWLFMSPHLHMEPQCLMIKSTSYFPCLSRYSWRFCLPRKIVIEDANLGSWRVYFRKTSWKLSTQKNWRSEAKKTQLSLWHRLRRGRTFGLWRLGNGKEMALETAESWAPKKSSASWNE
jgi:hypothetical protein